MQPGVIATDPAYIPLGTRLFVPGYGEGVAADTGGAVIGWTIDLWVSSCAEAERLWPSERDDHDLRLIHSVRTLEP